jgi:protein SCO1
MRAMNRNLLLVILVAGVAAIAGAGLGMLLFPADEPVEFTAGTRLTEPRPLPEFELTGHDGRAVTRDAFAGDWTLVFYGFTHCPDVCPNTLFMLDRVVARLAEEGHQTPGVLFISVDPERDSPQQIAEYVNYFNPGFLGATGDEENLATVAASMSVAYELRALDEGYDVIHSSAVLLIDPEARLHALFTPPLAANAIAADLRQLLPKTR